MSTGELILQYLQLGVKYAQAANSFCAAIWPLLVAGAGVFGWHMPQPFWVKPKDPSVKGQG